MRHPDSSLCTSNPSPSILPGLHTAILIHQVYHAFTFYIVFLLMTHKLDTPYRLTYHLRQKTWP